ncbi:MAG: hypothetical protein HYT12_03665 [Candidatus Liptonbacteria bacterium]|nr:hypothetical protein [Candidatus Liptonbacteria bacterium]
MRKTLTIIIISIILVLAGYLTYRYFFYTCCALPPKSIPTASSDLRLNDPGLLYAKRAFIGLCRTKSGDGGSCHYNTYLYASGKLTMESGELAITPDGEKSTAYPAVEKQLDKVLMDRIIKQIRDSGVMTKPCDAELVMDYFVNYFLFLDGIKKEAKFPGCEAEFNAIDKLIDTAADK